MSPSPKRHRTIISDDRSALLANRLRAVRRTLEERSLDAFLTSFLPHVRYLSGFTGSNGLCVVTSARAVLVTDGRYKDQVREETKGFTVRITRESLVDELPSSSVLARSGRIGFEHAVLPVAVLSRLQKLFPRKRFIPSVGVVESLAAVKDETEIAHVRRAVAITDAVFQEMLDVLGPGMTESEVAAELSYRQRRRGAEGDAFEPIVATGDHAALPHARASERRLKKGELVLLDFGCRVEGYCSDLTRTVAIGTPLATLRKLYRLVREAQERALERCAASVRAKDLDAVARAHFRRAGYAKYFSHSLGHGLGLQIHEEPRLSAKSSAILAAGNIVTIEPGLYVHGQGGVRIEDDVVVRAGGAEILTRASKDLIVL